MAPKRKTKSSAVLPNISPRKTRSTSSRKTEDPPATPPSKKVKVSPESSAEKVDEPKTKNKGKMKNKGPEAEVSVSQPSTTDPAASSRTIIIEACLPTGPQETWRYNIHQISVDISPFTPASFRCKQCNSFKTRALAVKQGLESAVSGVVITINPDKPRRGCFEIREEGGEVFVSLLNMPRPFKPMKALDMEKVVLDIAKKII